MKQSGNFKRGATNKKMQGGMDMGGPDRGMMGASNQAGPFQHAMHTTYVGEYEEKPRPNLQNVIQNLREGSVSQPNLTVITESSQASPYRSPVHGCAN